VPVILNIDIRIMWISITNDIVLDSWKVPANSERDARAYTWPELTSGLKRLKDIVCTKSMIYEFYIVFPTSLFNLFPYEAFLVLNEKWIHAEQLKHLGAKIRSFGHVYLTCVSMRLITIFRYSRSINYNSLQIS
jgi:hypothetical protein